MRYKRLTEKEIKHIISKSDYDRLIAGFGEKALYARQESCFFDTAENYFAASGYVIRIRRKAEKITLTVKTPGKREGAAFIRDEYNAFVTEEFLDNAVQNGLDRGLLPGFVRRMLIRSNIQFLRMTGRLVTLRARFEIAPGAVIILDKSEYGGKADYEIELEYNSDCQKAALEEFIKENSVLVMPSVSKAQRAAGIAGL